MTYQPETLKTYLDETLPARFHELRIPGFALAVIADSEIQELRGYGYRDLENKIPVDKNTQFAIGSSSKAFTTAVLAQLVDEGMLSWSDRVRDIIPEFRLKDPVAEAEMNIIDLQCHRGGMVSGDLAWIFLQENATRDELLKKMRYFDTKLPFRTRFSYNNYMWLTAGVVAERVTGKIWEELVQERIFNPLGMSANCSVKAMAKVSNRSFGYHDTGDDFVKLPYRVIDAMGPAGSINANIEDYARWMQLNVNKGKFGGQQLISEENMEVAFTPFTPITPDNEILQHTGLSAHKELKSFGYGLGWFYLTLDNRRVLGHGGNIDGFSAWLQFMPDDGVGVAVLTNANQNLLHYHITMEISELLLGRKPKDWVAAGVKKYKQGLEEQEQGKEAMAAMQVKDTNPSHELDAYAGKYNHPAYGDLTVELVDGKLACQVLGATAAVEHFHYDTFLLIPDGLVPEAKLPATFNFDMTGQVSGVALPLDEGKPAVVFNRIPGPPPEED